MQSPLRTFAAKVGIACVGAFVFLYASVTFIENELASNLKGGPEFWRSLESKLVKFANEKDMPEEKRARIIDALKKIGKKYGPFWDALNSR